MDLRARLARLDRRGAGGGPVAAAPAGAPRRVDLRPGDRDTGRVWLRRHASAEPAAPRRVEVLNRVTTHPAPAGLGAEDLLFLDTETTGLAGGTGTLPFLVGLGWWRRGAFHVTQYFLPSPTAERAMLAELVRIAGGFKAVVTFNGQTFDLPLLRTRGILARRRHLLDDLASWDLLPVSRRFWGRRLPDCRQQTVESRIAGLRRSAGDIDGALIPHAYFAFVRQGRVGALRAVLEHNRRDMVGMAAILGEALERAHLLDATEPPSDLPWQDAWSLARLCESSRDRAREAAWMARAEARARRTEPPRAFFVDAVRILKRTGDWPRISRLLERARRAHGPDPWFHLESAMLYEHRLPDLTRALDHARELGEPRRIARLVGLLGA
ncbi:ribonuclease H-like domain-containing protein [bacterium]|nr:ribonuclease H-like domain-containing protein [bacterium]